jgi:hypothetical protein
MMKNVLIKVTAEPKNVGETAIVNSLERLGVVSDAEGRVGGTTRVVVFEREPLEMRVKIGAQFKQRLQTDLHENVGSAPTEQAPDHLNDDEDKTKN